MFNHRECDVCGKEFDKWDDQENFSIHTGRIGYGSRFDDCKIDINMCCNCFDELIENYFIPKCNGSNNIIDEES